MSRTDRPYSSCIGTGGCFRPTTCMKAGSTISIGIPNSSPSGGGGPARFRAFRFRSSGAHHRPGAHFAGNLVHGALPVDGIIRFQAERSEGIARRPAVTKDAGALLTADGDRLLPLDRA